MPLSARSILDLGLASRKLTALITLPPVRVELGSCAHRPTAGLADEHRVPSRRPAANPSDLRSRRILFLADPDPDYVADGLFHGLRELLGANVVDWPKRSPMYRGAELSRLYGRGFGPYGLLSDLEVDRRNVFADSWDLVVSAVLWRDWQYWRTAWNAFGSSVRHVVVDGGDLPFIYPYGPAWWRPTRLFLPRAHKRAMYFKREWTRLTMLAAGRRVHLEPISISYPAEKMVTSVPAKTEDFPAHIVDLELGKRLGRELAHERAYVFDTEEDYLTNLRASRFGVTTRRAGWDAQRHLEIAGAGAIPCFRDLQDKPATCAPHGLIDGENCVAYRDADGLLARLDELTEADVVRMSHASLAWAHKNTTLKRATDFLERTS